MPKAKRKPARRPPSLRAKAQTKRTARSHPKSAAVVKRPVGALPEGASALMFSYQYAKGTDHGFVAVGHQAKALLGVSAAQLMKDAGALRLHPDDAAAFGDQMIAAMAKGQPVDLQVRVLRTSVDVRWIHICAWASAKIKGVRQYDGIMLDVTARKRAEAEVQGTLDRME